METSTDNFQHVPVLVEEMLANLPEQPATLLDCTLGGAGHSSALLSHCPEAQLRGIDRDPVAVEASRQRLETRFPGRTEARQARFSELPAYLKLWRLRYDFVIADLGMSSEQLQRAERGFSFLLDGPLDMRMDPNSSDPNAAQLLRKINEHELRRCLREYGEERNAAKITRTIIERRRTNPIRTTAELADLVASTIPRRFHKPGFHPATLTFQALRIAVNGELEELETLLNILPDFLNPGGRLAIISFHSLEDRPVKKQFREWEQPCTCPSHLPYCICGKQSIGRAVNRSPIMATETEVSGNPRSRSAKLRVFEFKEWSD